MATKEEIKALLEKPYSELTSEERRLVNLNKGMWEKGTSGNPAGKKKGCKSWQSVFQRLMGDEKFFHTIVTTLPKEWRDIVKETSAETIAAALIANVTKGVAKSLKTEQPLSKDVRAGIELINKLSYGEKVVHEAEEGFFAEPVIKYEVVPDRTDIKPDLDK